jgi:hypothetical protein
MSTGTIKIQLSVLVQYKANIVKMQLVLAMIQLKNFSFGIKQQSLTLYDLQLAFSKQKKKELIVHKW